MLSSSPGLTHVRQRGCQTPLVLDFHTSLGDVCGIHSAMLKRCSRLSMQRAIAVYSQILKSNGAFVGNSDVADDGFWFCPQTKAKGIAGN